MRLCGSCGQKPAKTAVLADEDHEHKYCHVHDEDKGRTK
jgi:hypothetical protein